MDNIDKNNNLIGKIIILKDIEDAKLEPRTIELKISGKTHCILINSSSIIDKKQAITLYDIYYTDLEIEQLLDFIDNKSLLDNFNGKYHYNSILGELPSDLAGGEKINGIYTENGIFYGKILNKPSSSEGGSFSGMDSNSNIIPSLYKKFGNFLKAEELQKISESLGQIVFWAGANSDSSNDISEAPFLIDSKGNMFSNNAYITNSILSNSVIQGSTLQVATIIGSGDNPALIIKDSTRGISILDQDNNEKFLVSQNNLISELNSVTFNIATSGSFLVSNNFSIGDKKYQYRKAYKGKEAVGFNLFIS